MTCDWPGHFHTDSQLYVFAIMVPFTLFLCRNYVVVAVVFLVQNAENRVELRLRCDESLSCVTCVYEAEVERVLLF